MSPPPRRPSAYQQDPHVTRPALRVLLAATVMLSASCTSSGRTPDASGPTSPEIPDAGTAKSIEADRASVQKTLARLLGGIDPVQPVETIGDMRNCSSRQACELNLGKSTFAGEALTLVVERGVDYEHQSATGGMRAFTFLLGLAERDGGIEEQWRLMMGLEEYFWGEEGAPYEVNVVDEPFLRPDGGLAVRSRPAEREPDDAPLSAPPGRATRVPRELDLQPYRGIVIPANLKPRRVQPSDSCLTIGHAAAIQSEPVGPLCLDGGDGCFTLVNTCRTALDVEGFVAHVSWKQDREGHPAGSAGDYVVDAPCVIPAGGWAYVDDSIESTRYGFALWRPRCSVHARESAPQ